MSQPDDLMPRVRSGDPEALSALLEGYRRQLLTYIERNLGAALRRKVEPEDVYQEVAVYAVKAMPAAEFPAGGPFGWLCHVAEQRIVDAHRKLVGAQKRAADREVPLGQPSGDSQRAALIDLLVVSMTSPTQAVARNQRHQKLQMALATLPPESQEALRLRYVENLPSKEIAARLGKSDGAVRVLLTRSLKRLQELLGPEAGL